MALIDKIIIIQYFRYNVSKRAFRTLRERLLNFYLFIITSVYCYF